jgi:thiosulfate/3-mercaptopyruvate sulfurtransferase
MKIKYFLITIPILILFFLYSYSKVGSEPTGEPWKKEQLMQPEDLAKKINESNKKPLIINIGPSGLIKGAVDIGPTQDQENLIMLKKFLSDKGPEEEVVVYCGCCPFKDCPNIRPAFYLINQMNFVNAKLLDINQNLRVNWIENGYPLED